MYYVSTLQKVMRSILSEQTTATLILSIGLFYAIGILHKQWNLATGPKNDNKFSRLSCSGVIDENMKNIDELS